MTLPEIILLGFFPLIIIFLIRKLINKINRNRIMFKESPFYKKKVIFENESAFCIEDGFPISQGHCLVVPKKYVRSIFDLNESDYLNCFKLVSKLKNLLTKKHNCENFNIGINDGRLAGQTVSHAHIHIIPRYADDIKDPRGGIRNILPDKTGYL